MRRTDTPPEAPAPGDGGSFARLLDAVAGMCDEHPEPDDGVELRGSIAGLQSSLARLVDRLPLEGRSS